MQVFFAMEGNRRRFVLPVRSHPENNKTLTAQQNTAGTYESWLREIDGRFHAEDKLLAS